MDIANSFRDNLLGADEPEKMAAVDGGKDLIFMQIICKFVTIRYPIKHNEEHPAPF